MGSPAPTPTDEHQSVREALTVEAHDVGQNGSSFEPSKQGRRANNDVAVRCLQHTIPAPKTNFDQKQDLHMVRAVGFADTNTVISRHSGGKAQEKVAVDLRKEALRSLTSSVPFPIDSTHFSETCKQLFPWNALIPRATATSIFCRRQRPSTAEPLKRTTAERRQSIFPASKRINVSQVARGSEAEHERTGATATPQSANSLFRTLHVRSNAISRTSSRRDARQTPGEDDVTAPNEDQHGVGTANSCKLRGKAPERGEILLRETNTAIRGWFGEAPGETGAEIAATKALETIALPPRPTVMGAGKKMGFEHNGRGVSASPCRDGILGDKVGECNQAELRGSGPEGGGDSRRWGGVSGQKRGGAGQTGGMPPSVSPSWSGAGNPSDGSTRLNGDGISLLGLTGESLRKRSVALDGSGRVTFVDKVWRLPAGYPGGVAPERGGVT